MVNESEHQLAEGIDAGVEEENCGVQEATLFPKNAKRFQQVFVLGKKLRQQVQTTWMRNCAGALVEHPQLKFNP